MRFELMTSSLPRKRSTPELHWLFRAEDEVRTRDPQLGRLMLYQLSYFRLFRFEGASSASLLLARILIYTSKLRCSFVAFLESTPSKRKTSRSFGASSASLLLARILIYTSKLRCSFVAFLESTPSKRKTSRSFGASSADASSCMCGERRIRTSEGVRQQIYSLPQLATLVSPRIVVIQ